VAGFLVTGQPVTREQSEIWDATGKAPVRETITCSELTKIYLVWRKEVTARCARRCRRSRRRRRLTGSRAAGDPDRVRPEHRSHGQRFEATRRELELQLVEKQSRLEHQALHDSLTGLANRQLTVDRAEQMLLRSRRNNDPVALCFIGPRQLQGHQRLARP